MPRVETHRFAWDSPEAAAFYDEHGYVIVRDVLSADERALVRPGWSELVAEAASDAELTPAAFEERFPQNRDLWAKSETFRRLLFETRQGDVARRFLGASGARLFHDHAIAKPYRRSGTIPWHQDSTYWPLDRAGNSLWTPTESVGKDGGCLKVLDRSHRDGAGSPQDFLQPDGVNRDDDPRLVYLPVEVGETVVLHGLTWHGSDPNRSTVDRLAYLTLWVPASARFTPAHAGWHPTTAHIEVEPGERLDGDWFPLFGELGDDTEGEVIAFEAPRGGDGLTMFKASDAIRQQIAALVDEPGTPLAELVKPDGRVRVADAAAALGLDRREVLEALANLELQERVRERSVARDVYLTTVQQWWDVAGHRLEKLLS